MKAIVLLSDKSALIHSDIIVYNVMNIVTNHAATWLSRRVLTHVGTVLAVETVADCQGVVVARTILPGEAESAVLSTNHKLLGDIRGYW